MSENKKWRSVKMTKKALMGLPEGGCIIKKDKNSEPIFFDRIPPKKEREALWKKIVKEGHRNTTFTVYDTYADLLKHDYESKPTKNIAGAIGGLYERIKIIHEIMKSIEKIRGFEHRSELLFLELEKFIESTFLEIILFLKKYLGIENAPEFKHKDRYFNEVFCEISKAGEGEYKLMICNLALITDFYEKNGDCPVMKEVVAIIYHKYRDELKPLYKKYGERVLTDYGIPVH